MELTIICRDYGRPGCLEVPDEKYTMHFDIIGEPPIYWCSHCGPDAEAIDKALTKALDEAHTALGDDFESKLRALVTKMEEEAKATQS